MGRRTTIKDIAKEVGMSSATVSRALNNHQEINIETRNIIKKTAKELHYVPNSLARSLVSNNSKSIGILVPDIANPFFPKVISGIEDYARTAGRSVIIANTGYDEEREVQTVIEMLERRVEGMVIIPCSVDTMKNIKDIEADVPVVYVCAKAETTGDRYVVVDDRKMAYMATKYLLDLGHDEFVFVGGSIKVPGIIERVKGFGDALKEKGLPFSESMVVHCSITRQSGYDAVIRMIEERHIPSAIVSGNDFVAIGAMQALNENGYKVPEDVSIIGFDDVDFAGFSQINLTTMEQPKYAMGRKAAQLLIKSFKGNEEDIAKVVMESSIKMRSTCKRKN